MTGGTAPLTRGYAIELQQEEDETWTAIVPDLPGCVAAGRSAADAIGDVGDAIEAWIASARADGAPIPAPSRGEDEYSGRFVARVPKSLHRALASRASREGVSLNTLCITALTQVITQGLLDGEYMRLAAARTARLRFQATPYRINLYERYQVPPSPDHPQFQIIGTADPEPSLPAGMIDAMRSTRGVRA